MTEEVLWEDPYVGSDPSVLYLPDANAVYWRYGWTRDVADMSGMVIKGTVPDARYFSYNVYDDNTKNTLGSVPDFAMKLEDGAINPFTGVETSQRGTYTLYIVPEGTEIDAPNVLTFPASLEKVSFMLRHYLPKPKGDILGGAPMPTIQRYDLATGNSSPALKSNEVPSISAVEAKKYLAPLLQKAKENPEAALEKLMAKHAAGTLDIKEMIVTQVVAPAFTVDDPATPVIESYRLGVSGNYPTDDNFYLVLPVERPGDEVLLVKFRAPGVVRQRSDYPTADVRYFSIGQGDERSYNMQSLYDETMKVAPDGFVYLVIGDDSAELRAKAEAFGANFMAWQVRDKMLLVYRNMIPRADYKTGVNSVPFYDHAKPASSQTGRTFIGDYAPVGILMNPTAVMGATAFPDF